jgi:toxin ParE1/3/4
MANKKVEFHEAASLELEAAFDWYLDRSESAAARFLADLNNAVATIAEAPHRWPEGNHGTRKFLLRRFPFAIVYRDFPSSVQVVAVAHGHRRPGYWKNRL